MDSRKKISGLVIATAAAAVFAMAPVSSATAGSHQKASSASDNVKCYGMNKCKGHSACKTAENACKGQNKCKGHGFVKVSQTACDDIGGEVKK